MGKITRRFCVASMVLLTLLALSAFLATPHLLIRSDAMGSSPATCRNLYNDTIVSFTINNGTQTFNPLTNRGIQFESNQAMGYNISFSIQSSAKSQSGNTDPGQVWYVTNFPNGYFGFCVNVTGPNAIVNESIHITKSSADQNPTPVVWGNQTNESTVYYNPDWVSMYSVVATTTNGALVTGVHVFLYYEGQNIISNRTIGTEVANGSSPIRFALEWGTRYAIQVENSQDYVFSHWADIGSTNNTRTVPYNESKDVSLNAVFVPTSSFAASSSITTTSSSNFTAISRSGSIMPPTTAINPTTTNNNETTQQMQSNGIVPPFQLPETDLIIAAIAGIIVTTGTITALKLRRH